MLLLLELFKRVTQFAMAAMEIATNFAVCYHLNVRDVPSGLYTCR
jgi:hypothetical protein